MTPPDAAPFRVRPSGEARASAPTRARAEATGRPLSDTLRRGLGNPVFWLVVAVCLGGALRIQHLGYGVPGLYKIGSVKAPPLHPDEHALVQEVRDVLDNPLYYKDFKYPPLHPQLSALVAWTTGLRDEPSLYLISRWISVLASTLTIVVVFRLGLRWSRQAAALAALLFAFAMVAAREAHWANPEPLAALFLSLAFLLSQESPNRLRPLLAGACLGLSVCAKLFGALFLHLALIPLLLAWKDPAARKAQAARFGKFCLGFCLTAGVGLGYFIFVNPGGFADFLTTNRSWASGVGAWGAYPPPVTPPHYTTWVFPAALGLPLYLTALAGVGYLLWNLRKTGGLALVILPFWVFLEALHYRPIRFTCSLVPFLCLAAALALWKGGAILRKAAAPPLLARSLAAFVVVFSLLYTWSHLRTLDPRRDPREYMEETAAKATGRVLLLGVNRQTVTLDLVRYYHSVDLAGEGDQLEPGDTLFVPETFVRLLEQWRNLESLGYRYTRADWWPMKPPAPAMGDFPARLREETVFRRLGSVWNRPALGGVATDWFDLPFDYLFLINLKIDVYRYEPPR